MDHFEPGSSLQLQHNLSIMATNPVTVVVWLHNKPLFLFNAPFLWMALICHTGRIYLHQCGTRPAAFKNWKDQPHRQQCKSCNFPRKSPNHRHRLTGVMLCAPQPLSLFTVKGTLYEHWGQPLRDISSWLQCIKVEYGWLGKHPFTSEYKLKMNIPTAETGLHDSSPRVQISIIQKSDDQIKMT